MASQTITQTEIAPSVSILAQALPERSAPESVPQVGDVKEDTKEQPSEPAKDKPKVRRIIDEEGGTTTATVGSYDTLSMLD